MKINFSFIVSVILQLVGGTAFSLGMLGSSQLIKVQETARRFIGNVFKRGDINNKEYFRFVFYVFIWYPFGIAAVFLGLGLETTSWFNYSIVYRDLAWFTLLFFVAQIILFMIHPSWKNFPKQIILIPLFIFRYRFNSWKFLDSFNGISIYYKRLMGVNFDLACTSRHIVSCPFDPICS